MGAYVRMRIVASLCVGIASATLAEIGQSRAYGEGLGITNVANGHEEKISASQEWASELGDEREEEHESNGPEGAAGRPMQKPSIIQAGLAVGILFAASGLLFMTVKGRASAPEVNQE